jgi:hypothetical protein
LRGGDDVESAPGRAARARTLVVMERKKNWGRVSIAGRNGDIYGENIKRRTNRMWCENEGGGRERRVQTEVGKRNVTYDRATVIPGTCLVRSYAVNSAGNRVREGQRTWS